MELNLQFYQTWSTFYEFQKFELYLNLNLIPKEIMVSHHWNGLSPLGSQACPAKMAQPMWAFQPKAEEYGSSLPWCWPAVAQPNPPERR
jgi:hypothetical protein